MSKRARMELAMKGDGPDLVLDLDFDGMRVCISKL